MAAGGDDTCALLTGGKIVRWGGNGHGQLGDGSTSQRSLPTTVSGLDGSLPAAAAAVVTTGVGPTNADVPSSARPVATSVSASRSNTCVVLTDTVVRCWGDNSTDQLGDGIGPISLSPRTVALAGGL